MGSFELFIIIITIFGGTYRPLLTNIALTKEDVDAYLRTVGAVQRLQATQERRKPMTTQQTQETKAKITNGVNVTQMFDTIAAVRNEPELGKFQFRARNHWLDGSRNQATIKEFYGAGQEDNTRTESYVFQADEPPILCGDDQGANPVEYLLSALSMCLTTTMVMHGASRGIEIEAVDSELEGDLDVRGFLGLSDEVRKGYHDVRVKMRVKSDAPAEKLAELAKYSPVYDVVSNSLPVHVEVETY